MPGKRGWGKGDGEREGRRPPRGDGRTKEEELNYLDKGDAYPLSANRVIEPRTFAHSNVANTHSNTRDTRARAVQTAFEIGQSEIRFFQLGCLASRKKGKR